MNNTYQERVGRYRIIRHDELPESHKAEYRLKGIDPDDNWQLIWSFSDLAAAENCLNDCKEDAPVWSTYKLVDAGKEEFITRQAWF